MATTTAVNFQEMDQYCTEKYGYGLTQVDSTCAMWVAEHFGGFANWKKIRTKREKLGKLMMSPTFQSPCWA
jgi:hypothetical protein